MDPTEISLQTIWEAIQGCKVEMTAHFDSKIMSVETGLTSIQSSLSSLCDQISELEQRVSANEDNVGDMMKRVADLEKENAYLKDKVDDIENRSRSCNLRFVGIPERSEGKDVIAFIKQLISTLLGFDDVSSAPDIERAHRYPTYKSSSNARSSPRTILVKFLHFHDKVKILRLAREKGSLSYQGARVHIYPDFSATLVKKRQEFNAVKKILRNADMKYSLLYPATLRVTVKGKPKLFRCPVEAENFFQSFSPSD